MFEGRKEVEDGRKEKEGKNVGRKEGRKDGRKEGRKVVRKE